MSGVSTPMDRAACRDRGNGRGRDGALRRGLHEPEGDPLIDLYSLEDIRLVGRYLRRAVMEGGDGEARAGLARASLYGGFCLGPVNTTAGVTTTAVVNAAGSGIGAAVAAWLLRDG